jgi:poly(3-hydroxyalkanoate) depolymerase
MSTPQDVGADAMRSGQHAVLEPGRSVDARPMAAEPTTRHVTICNQQLRVDVRAGNGTGTPLVMCCGIGASFELLQPLVDALDPGIDIIRFDVPGVGGSPVGALPHGFPQLAWMLGRILDELGYDEVDVIGFSWGGALAQQFAVQHAGRCRRLVLICTNTGVWSVPGAPWLFAKMATPHGFRANAMSILAGSGDDGNSRARADEVRRLFRDTLASSGRGFLYQLAAAASWSSLPFLKLIRQPVLVMGGDHDPIVPVTNARILAALIPNATLQVFAGGHLEPLTAATEFGPRISQFLSRQRP